MASLEKILPLGLCQTDDKTFSMGMPFTYEDFCYIVFVHQTPVLAFDQQYRQATLGP